ncbi:LuxR C-terminal-related transcriptional regulator [Streptomyces sp. NPDC005498]|uniref:LuxR C-terminal-related transcriptional regulator n=1 Tax=Streptomyces sp. NPDC005498 TaxID=3364717 RepID=UPI0036A6DE76
MLGRATDLSPTPPLRGRREEQERLTQWVRRLTHRHDGGVLWIEGPADTGKSRMLAYTAAEASVAGARVLSGTGITRDGIIAMAPLLDALSSDGESDVMDDLSVRVRERNNPYELLQAIKERLEALTRQQPVVIILDDVQKCDDLTLLAIRTLTQQLARQPLLWVLASREHNGVSVVETLRRDLLNGPAVRMSLGPLEPEAVRLMTRDLLGGSAIGNVECVAYADGLPGSVQVACACLINRSAGIPDRSPAEFQDVQPVIRAIVARRLGQLTDEARELMLIAAVLGGSFTVGHLSQVLKRPESALLRPLREVLAAKLLEAGPDRLYFPLEPVREAVANTLPRPVRLSIRRRSIELRLESGASAVSLAPELARIAETGDALAVRVLHTAALELGPVSPRTAADYLRRAVSLLPDMSSERRSLSADLVPLLWQAGQADEARVLAGAVLRTPTDPLTHAQVCLHLARMGGQFPVLNADAHLRQVHRHRNVPVPLKDQLLSMTLLNQLLEGEVEEASGAMGDSLMRTRGMHPVSEVTHRTLQSMSACHRQNWSEALKYSDAAATGIAELLHPVRAAILPEIAVSTAWRAALLDLAGKHQAALELVESRLADAEQHEKQALLPLWRNARARLLMGAGRLAEAQEEVARARRDMPLTCSSLGSQAALLCTEARLAFHIGDDDAIEACARQSETYLAGEDLYQQRMGAWIAVVCAAYRGTTATRQQFTQATAYLRRGFVHATCVDAADTVFLVGAALAAGFRDIAAATVEFAEQRAQRNPRLPVFRATALHARGLLEGDDKSLLEAAERYGRTRPLLRAQALEDAGFVLNAAQAPAARRRREQAMDLYTSCGAHRDGRRSRSRLRKLGVKPATSSPIPVLEWRGLTPAELNVVRLIASGTTNRQAAERLFLSPHTVNTHVRHAFEKLGVRSRVQMTRLYMQEVDEPAAL